MRTRRWLPLLVVLTLLAALGGTSTPADATGNGAFGPNTDYTTAGSSFSVAVADLNGDGKLDLVTANYTANSVSVLLGVGDGTFGTKTDYPTGTDFNGGKWPVSVAIADFNGDGKLDLVTANVGANTVGVLLGKTTNPLTFETPVYYTTGYGANTVAVGDFNGDTIPDLVTSNQNGSSVSIFLGSANPRGTFAMKTDFAVASGSSPSFVAVADLNNDSKLDLVTASGPSQSGNSVSVLLGKGDGTFPTHVDYPTSFSTVAVALGDVNGDSKPDIVATAGYNVDVLLGSGTGTFGAAQSFAAGTGTSGASSVAIGDLNGDGKADLVTANLQGASASVLLGKTTTPLAFETKVNYTTAAYPRSVALGRFNQDSALDLVTGNDGASVSVLLNVLFAPTVTSITPSSGPTAGMTSVTIGGTGFEPGATVTVGGVVCTGVTVVSPTSITCTTGAHVAGPVDVVVTNTDTQFGTLVGGYRYVGPPPAVTSINPASGPTAGGQPVTLTGTNFSAPATVTFDGVSASNVTVVSSTQVTATTPAHAAGPVDVVVTNPDAQTGTLTAGYTYVPPPTVSGINPTSGPTGGGLSVTIGGTGFKANATVELGTAPCTNVFPPSATSITCITSAHAPGLVDVVVTNPTDSQSGTLTNGYNYLAPAPSVASIAPTSGTTAGGTAVTISGTGFQAGATAKLGTVSCAVTGTTTATTLTCTTGAHAAGTVDVVVTNTDTQFGTLAGGYRYVAPPPAVSSISPASGPTAGGQAVTISGTGFQAGATTKLGTVNCAVTGATTATTLTCTTGANSPGAVNVVLTNPDGQPSTQALQYTYVAPAAPLPPPPAVPPLPPPVVTPVPAPGDNYSLWRSLDGVLVGIAPTTVTFKDRLYIIAVGVDRQLYELHSNDGVEFTPWRPIGGLATSAVAATVYNGELYLFVRGSDSQLYMMRSTDGASFTAWVPLGGVLSGAPSAASFGGQLLVYATGADYTLYMTNSANGSAFSSWSSLGGVLSRQARDATALTINQARLYLYARGEDGHLYATSSSDGATYGAWRDLGGVLTSGPAAASVGNTQVVFVRGADNRIYETRSVDGGGVYSNWRELGGVLVTAPSATSFLGQVYVVTQGVDAALYLQNSRP